MSGPRFTGHERDRRWSYAVMVLFGIVALIACITLIAPVVRIGMWVDGPNEGWNALHSLHSFSTALYPPRDTLMLNNYPPLWFYLGGALARVFGDPVIPGRIVSMLAFAGTAFAIFMIVCRLGAGAVAGAVAALAFIATIAVLYRWWVGVAEPQMLAHALITGGAALLVGAQTRRMAALAAFIMVIGGLTKHIAVALPIASLIWLAIYHRGLLYAWLGTGILTGCAALLGLVTGYGEVFIQNVAVPRTFSINVLGSNLGWGITKTIVPLVGFSIIAARIEQARDEAMAFAGLSIAAALLSIVTFGSAGGVVLNVSIDLVIASSIAFGLVWDRVKLLSRVPANIARMILLAALNIRLLLGFNFPGPMIAGFRSISADMIALQDQLARIPDPVACDAALLACLAAGHRSPSRVEWVHDREGMLARLANGEFNAVITNPDFTGERDGRHLRGLADAMTRGYRPPIYFGNAGNLFLSRRLAEP